MAALTRTNSRATPGYKDYVNFLGGYKNGKKDDEHFTTDVPAKNFPLTSSSSNTSSSSSSMSSDVTDFSKNSVTSYNTYLENSKNKKFQPVKPNLEEKETKVEEKTLRVSDVKSNFEEKKEKTTMKSEIFIEIQPVKSVSEVSKIFEKKELKKPLQKSNSINSKISIFEKQIPVENRPKIATKPGMNRSSLPKIHILPPQPKATTPSPPPEIIEAAIESAVITNVTPPPVPPPMPSFDTRQKPAKINDFHPPAPVISNATQPKLQATLTKGPQTTYSVSNPNGAVPNQIDRNDPMVKKLVYGTLRGLYGAYHDKASDMLATLPRNMVVKSNGVQDRIEQIAANGDLDKLNGRINPKLEQE